MSANLSLEITDHAYQKIMHWVNKSNFEVSGLGTLTHENGVFRVHDVLLLPQKNTATHTDIDPAEVAKAMYELRLAPGDLRFWWHSHVNMDVFWSGEDRNTINEISKGGWFVSSVFNKKREIRSCFAAHEPIKVMLDNLPTTITRQLAADFIASLDAEYAAKVTNVTPTFRPTLITANNPGMGTPRHETKKERKARKKAEREARRKAELDRGYDVIGAMAGSALDSVDDDGPDDDTESGVIARDFVDGETLAAAGVRQIGGTYECDDCSLPLRDCLCICPWCYYDERDCQCDDETKQYWLAQRELRIQQYKADELAWRGGLPDPSL